MKYGYFDNENKEYVITRPDTPAPWVNYLGSPEYGAIISNNATGYSFKKSGAKGRVLRHRFNSLSNDAPGRYLYLKDRDSGDYWSCSWAPVCKPLSQYKSECRHGMGYTAISSEYGGIAAETVYFVPMDARHEVWQCRITNQGDAPRKLSVIGCASFVNHSDFSQDQVDLQCTLFLTSTSFQGNYIYQFHRFEPGNPPMERFFALADGKVDAYCGDRDAFLGGYRGYPNPQGVENGLHNDLNYNGNSVGALQSDITLAPGESKTFTYLLGQESKATAEKLIARYEDGALAQAQLAALKQDWHARVDALKVQTPDENLNAMVNVWNAYNCYMTFLWSRAASFIYCGLRNGYGYRDTVQDIQGIIHLDPALAKEKIKFMLSAQVTSGAGLPLVKFNHDAGHEDTPEDDSYVRETGHPAYRSDDALWLFPTVKKYIGETGDVAFLDEKIVYANDPAPVSCYDHLKKALEFTATHLGKHGLPLVLHADWNDSLHLGEKGESVFVAFQTVLAAKILREYALLKNDTDYISYLDALLAQLGTALDGCWDGDRWIRAYRENGRVLGAREEQEASFWLNPQTWSVLADFGSREQQLSVMDLVAKELNTPYGAKLFNTPYSGENFPGKNGMSYFNNYTKENASIFCQTQGWLLLAEAKLGRGNAAYRYWTEINPAEYNDRAELRTMEPYVFGQFTEASGSPFAGRSHVHWLTGTASTVMVGLVEGILGLRPQPEGLVIDPAIPAAWDGFTMEKRFRGKQLSITVRNPEHRESGVRQVALNGQTLPGVLIPAEALEEINTIEVLLG